MAVFIDENQNTVIPPQRPPETIGLDIAAAEQKLAEDYEQSYDQYKRGGKDPFADLNFTRDEEGRGVWSAPGIDPNTAMTTPLPAPSYLRPPGAKPTEPQLAYQNFLTEYKKFASSNGIKLPDEINMVAMVQKAEDEVRSQWASALGFSPMTPEQYKQMMAQIKEKRTLAEHNAMMMKSNATNMLNHAQTTWAEQQKARLNDEDYKRRVSFESLYPQYRGRVGTEDYAKAFLAYKNSASSARAEVFGKIPTNIPGIYFNRTDGTYNTTNDDGTKRTLSTDEVKQLKLQVAGEQKAVQTANSPTFQRMIKNAQLLTEPTIDPVTGKQGESEIDKLIRLRNDLPDSTFSSMNNKFRAFNSWDQFFAYQFSNEKMAKLKSAIIANVERLGAVYAGGGTVTSDKKMELAASLLDAALAKPAFAALLNMHKESIRNTAARYSQIEPLTFGGQMRSPQQQSGSLPQGFKKGW
jgi:hypothetical protein